MVRQLFTKMSRGLDAKNMVLAIQEANIEELEAQVTRLRPKKRQKVTQDPNNRFININDIYTTRVCLQESLDP